MIMTGKRVDLEQRICTGINGVDKRGSAGGTGLPTTSGYPDTPVLAFDSATRSLASVSPRSTLVAVYLREASLGKCTVPDG